MVQSHHGRKVFYLVDSLNVGGTDSQAVELAAGLPTIVSRVGGNAEMVEDSVTGLLVPPEDSPALSAGLLKLLRDQCLAWQMAQSGREFTIRDFSFERLVSEVDALSTELLQRGGGNH